MELDDGIFSHAYIWMYQHNGESNSNPYHNEKHILFVFYTSMELFDKYRKEFGLKSKDRINLGLAAIFHDFRHSGGKLTDKENIQIATQGLKEYLEYAHLETYYDEIKDILESTEYPHKEKEYNILQKIIMDADTTIPNDFIGSVNSLCSEWKKNIIDFIPTEIKFIDTIKYHLPYSNKLIDSRRDKLKKDLLKFQSDLMFK